MKPNLLKYKIGLIAIALFMIGLVGYVLMQANATKQDTKTNSVASSIADKLNTYITNNQSVPTTLAQAGAKSIPSTITYQKLSDDSYRFCATYKANSSGFDPASAVADVAAGGAVDTSDSGFTDNSELFIDSTYHKGTNCQTINPDLVQTQPIQCSSATPTSICSSDNASPNMPPSTKGSAATAITDLCGYNASSQKGCSVRCDQSLSAKVHSLTDNTVNTIATVGNAKTLNVTDTKGAKHTVTVTSDTKLYGSLCQKLTWSDFQVDDQVRVIVSGTPSNDTQGAKVTASEIDDFSL